MTQNPFEQPRAESTGVAATSPRTPLFGALAILVLDQTSRQLGQQRLFLQGLEQVGTQMMYAGIAAMVGIAIAFVLVMKLGYRQTILVGAALLAVAALIPQETLVSVPLAAGTRAMISVSLLLLLARSNAAAPELRDAWLTAMALAVGTGGFVGQLGGFTLRSISLAPAIQSALALGIIPLALTLLPAKLPEGTGVSRQYSTWAMLGAGAGILVVLAASSRSMLLRNEIDTSDVIARSALSFLIPFGAVLIYALTYSPEKADRAPRKLIFAGIAALFALALAVVASVQFPGIGLTYTFFHQLGTTLCVPIALGIAATAPRYSIAAVSLFSVFENALRY